MLVPVRDLVIITFYSDICSACAIIKFLALCLLLQLQRIILIPLLFLLFLLNFPYYISLLIFKTLLSHYIIVSSLYTDRLFGYWAFIC